MFSGLWLKFAGLGAVILAFVGALFAAKQSGKKEAKLEQTEQALEQSEGAHAIDESVRAMPASAVDGELRSKYSRD